MKVKSSDVEGGWLELDCGDVHKFRGIVMAAFGFFFCSLALIGLTSHGSVLFKLIALGILGFGATIAYWGVGTAIAEHSISVERDRGITFRWKWGTKTPRQLFVGRADIEALEIIDRLHENMIVSRDLVLVKKDGTSVGIEKFASRAQAELRKKSIESVL